MAILQMSCSTGAPFFDPTVPVRPMNTLSLLGSAGSDVVLSLPSGSDAWFYPDGVQTLQLRLDADGAGSAQVYSFSTGNVLANVYVVTNPVEQTSASMTFTDWLKGQGELSLYGMSTGAQADGNTHCSVYLQTNSASAATQAALSLTTGSAIITISGKQKAFEDVSSHVGSFDITDNVIEAATFTLSLVDTEDYVSGILSFVEPLHYIAEKFSFQQMS
ncbi:hypothetical protein [Citrobacter youngae]|nr:hypothetical protein [Citrobacter youngae]